jgi:sulfur carrier protein
VDITVIVNGQSRDVPEGSTAADLVTALGFAGRPLAVEVNEAVVPRPQLADCRLKSGDRLELVTLVGGG